MGYPVQVSCYMIDIYGGQDFMIDIYGGQDFDGDLVQVLASVLVIMAEIVIDTMKAETWHLS